MTFQELQDAALGTSFDPTRYRSYAKRFLNRAQQRVARRIGMAVRQASSAITLIVGTHTYDLPADFIGFRGEEPLIDAQGWPLEEVSIDRILSAAAAAPTSTGTPCFFAYEKGRLRLYPTPATVQDLTLIYRAGAPALIADTDVPVIPVDYHELLPLYAKGRLYQEEDDQQAGAQYLAMFEQELREMRGEQQAATHFRRQVPRRFGGRAPTFRLP